MDCSIDRWMEISGIEILIQKLTIAFHTKLTIKTKYEKMDIIIFENFEYYVCFITTNLTKWLLYRKSQ